MTIPPIFTYDEPVTRSRLHIPHNAFLDKMLYLIVRPAPDYELTEDIIKALRRETEAQNEVRLIVVHGSLELVGVAATNGEEVSFAPERAVDSNF